MAMADLAKYGADGALPLSAIAERQQISLAYLEQLFLKLRRAGLVESARGRSGGYRLGRPAGRHQRRRDHGRGRGGHAHDALRRRGGQAVHGGPALPHARSVGRAGRADRSLPGQRDAARGDRRHPGRASRPCGSGRPPASLPGLAANERARAHISTGTRRRRCAPRRGRRCWPRSIASAIRRRRMPRAAARARSSRMRASRLPRWSGAKPAEVVFTSGGTEANNCACWRRLGGDPGSRRRARLRCWRQHRPRGNARSRLIEHARRQRRRRRLGDALATRAWRSCHGRPRAADAADGQQRDRRAAARRRGGRAGQARTARRAYAMRCRRPAASPSTSPRSAPTT